MKVYIVMVDDNCGIGASAEVVDVYRNENEADIRAENLNIENGGVLDVYYYVVEATVK